MTDAGDMLTMIHGEVQSLRGDVQKLLSNMSRLDSSLNGNGNPGLWGEVRELRESLSTLQAYEVSEHYRLEQWTRSLTFVGKTAIGIVGSGAVVGVIIKALGG